MITFIAGMLTGFLVFAIVVVLIDHFLYADQDVNPIDIVGGVLTWLRDGFVKLVNRGVRRPGYIADAELFQPTARTRVTDEGDEDMAYIDSVVEFCKEGER